MLKNQAYPLIRNVAAVALALGLLLVGGLSYLQSSQSNRVLHEVLETVQPLLVRMGDVRVQLVRAHQLVDRVVRRGLPRTQQVSDELRSLMAIAQDLGDGPGRGVGRILAAWFALLDEEAVSATGDGALNARHRVHAEIDALYRDLGVPGDDDLRMQIFVSRLHGAVQSINHHLARDRLSVSLPDSLLKQVMNDFRQVRESVYLKEAQTGLVKLDEAIRRYVVLFGHFVDEQRVGRDELALKDLEAQIYAAWDWVEVQHLQSYAAVNRVLDQYRSVALMEADRSLYMLSLALVFVVVLAIVVFIVPGMVVDRRTRALVEATQRFASGDETTHVDAVTRDAFGELAESFNRMVETISAQQADMRELARQAQAANVSKSQFLSKVSHELRTPMNAVLGMTQLLRASSLDKRQLQYVDRLSEGANVMMGMVEDLLDVAQLETGSVAVSPQPFGLREMLEDVARKSTHLVPAGIEFRYVVGEGVPEEVVGDRRLISQVLMHLTDNALKFTRAGGVVVGVSGGPQVEGYCMLRFSVADTGVGITPNKLAKLFDPFEQGDNSNTRVFGGAGIGLSVSRGLLRLMDSEMVVESTPGEGSVFSFELELAIAGSEADDVQHTVL